MSDRGLAARRSRLTPAKRELLADLIRSGGAGAADRIRRRQVQAPAPLSFAQQRLWFLDRLFPGSSAYNIVIPLRLEGRLDTGVLRRVLSELVRRHESLRTTFEESGGEPVQRIHPPTFVPVPLVDLRRLPAPARQREVRRLGREEAGLGFDLGRGPLLRACLLCLGAEEHVLLTNMHHIVSDGWSAGIMAREVSILYGAFRQGLPSPLPELEIQYADFAVWQRRRLEGASLEAHLSYWRRHLEGLPPVLDLPTDRPRSAVRGDRGAAIPVVLGRDLSASLAVLGRQENVTPFIALLALFEVLLSRCSGQELFGVGTPIAGRTQVEVEPLIGFFVNTLVLRADLAGEPTFREMLGRVRKETLDSLAHQELPFEKMVEDLGIERSLLHTPLFQVMFTFQNAPEAPLELAGLRLLRLGVDDESSKFDLSLTLAAGHGGFGGGLEYSTDLFDRTTVQRLAQNFGALASAMVADLDRGVWEQPFLLPEERQQVLLEWNDTEATLDPGGVCVHTLFEAQAERFPERIAVVFERESLSYQELDSRAGLLAQRLRCLGVGPEVRVGICLERSLELVVAVLAVLKSGGAWVPLDAEEPEARVSLVMRDAGMAVLLTRSDLAVSPPREVCRVDLDREDFSARSSGSPARGLTPDVLMYVIFTSGSTGRPKGVMVPHRGVVNRLLWSEERYPVAPEDRILLKAAFSFDASVWELLAPLISGGCLIVALPGGQRDPACLVRTILEHEVTLIDLVPSLLRALLAEEGIESCRSLRSVASGGEALPPELAALFFRKLEAELRNTYGPTEASIDVVAHVCAREGFSERSVPLGRPHSNVTARVLGRKGLACPIGVPGELHLGGVALARGYLGRPELTAEKFVPDPFGAPGSRLYRTGDLARQLPDGRLEFLGRLDHQVKLRGFRIELGEIEAALRSHPEVRQAVVVVREDAPGDRRLVAYLVTTMGGGAVVWREWLSARLPEYMIPAAFVFLESLPLTASGKVDRRALPAPEWRSEVAATAPSTPAEELLAGIWGEVLGVDRVGIRDDFFALGGHSLLATQVVSRVRKLFGIELPLRGLFEAPVLADLAARIERQRGGELADLPLAALPREGELALSFAQQRLWFLDRLLPGSPLYNIPSAFRLAGDVSPALLERVWSEVVRRHEALRTTFATVDGEAVQRIHPAEAVAVPVVDLAGLPEDFREGESWRLVREEAGLGFDLERGPLFRVRLLRLGGGGHVLLATQHHIVSDGWSTGVLAREVSALYDVYGRGLPSPLPELPIQYADFAGWQRLRLSGETLERELAHWRLRLSDLPAVLELPTDRPRPALQGFRGGSVPVLVDSGLSSALGALCRREQVTPFMFLLAVFEVLLGRVSEQDLFGVGTPIAGRNRVELEPLIGFFVNTLVQRADLRGAPGFQDFLRQVREEVLDSHAHQEMPFERLVEDLEVERSLSHTPLFQVLFVFQNVPESRLELPGLQLVAADAESGVAKFDLSLALAAGPGGLAGVMEHSKELFDRATIQRWVFHFESLAAAVLADPVRGIWDLPLLSSSESHQLQVEWNDTEAMLDPRGECVHRLIEAQAARVPERIAVVFEGESLSYGELNRRANRLAFRLCRLGVGPEVLVGICLERSLDLVTAVLAVLKTGGAYVPLDPAYPGERMAYMVEDSGLSVLVTWSDLAVEQAAGGLRRVVLDGVEPEAPSFAEQNPVSGVTAEHPMYVIYTSGSTGRPKGVMVAHRGVVNRLLWGEVSYPVTGADRVLLKTAFSFDVSVVELFAPLVAGACLVVARPGGQRDSGYLVQSIIEQEVTLAFFVPSLLQALLAEEGVARCKSLRWISAAGEALPVELVALCLRKLGGVLRNQYGPTEASIDVTDWICRREGSLGRSVPLGRPHSNVTARVLGRKGLACPIGAPGELHLGGVALARGYLGRPELTAEKFVPDPFGAPGSRLYRTGDLARQLPDGRLEFLGRLDHQVKLRGFRIELGEIEAALRSHPEVHQSVVVVREDAPGDRRLVAYLVVVGGGGAVAWREWLSARLPEYMIPAAFVVLESLPLTASGKVDRQALPAPEWRSKAAYVPPGDPVEELLAGIWAAVLGVDRVGIRDDFFALGGHSLTVVRLMARVRAGFGRELPVASLFQHPTVESLAELLHGDVVPARPSPLVPIQGAGARRPFYCVHPVGGTVVCYTELARQMGTSRPFVGLQAFAGAGEPSPVPEMASTYLRAMRAEQPHGPYLLGGWSLGGLIAMEMARQLEAAGERAALVVLLDPTPPGAVTGVPGPAQLVREFARDLVGLQGGVLGPLEVIEGESRGEAARRLFGRLRAQGLIPPDLELAALEGQLEIFHRNLAAVAVYRPQPISSRVALFTPGASAGGATEVWRELASGGIETYRCGGDHYSLLRTPHVEGLGAALRSALDAAKARPLLAARGLADARHV